MEGMGKGKRSSNTLPPGFRFHPTDEELIIYYLKNQATSKPCPVAFIPEIDIYKFDPWQLPEKAEFGEKEWYFFTPRDRKYPNGIRPNRATISGYWKATGTDKAIYSATKYVGIKKALVFYKGRPPKGIKTDWIMHEYRLTESRHRPVKPHGSMRLDDWVLCRIYKKRHVARTEEIKTEELDSPQQSQLTIGFGSSGGANRDHHQIMSSDQYHNQQQQQSSMKFPRTHSLSYLLDLDYLGPIAHLLNDNTTPGYDSSIEFQPIMGNQPGLDPNVGPFFSQFNSQQMYGSGTPSNFK